MSRDGKYEFITARMMDAVAAEARLSPRLRMNRNFHRSTSEPVNRLLNVMHRGSYVPVHRHLSPDRAESCVVLRGSVGLTLYDDDGGVMERRIVSASGDCRGFDIEAGVWHDVTVLEDDTVLFEVKQGPFAPLTPDNVAPWSPAVDDVAAVRKFVSESETEFNKKENYE